MNHELLRLIMAAQQATGGGGDPPPDPPPGLTLWREVTFEQPNGFNGWTNPSGVITDAYGDGRDGIDDAFMRMGWSGGPAIRSSEQAFNGGWAAKFIPAKDGVKGRCELEPLGNNAEGVERGLDHGVTYWLGYAFYNASPQQHSSWEINFQLHNSGPEKSGYGSTANPSIALMRNSDSTYQVAYRSNGPGGSRPEDFIGSIPVAANAWQRFVWKIKEHNPDGAGSPQGVLGLWTGGASGALTKHFELTGIQLGYVYADPQQQDAQVPKFGVYHGALDGSRLAYGDDFRISADPAADQHSVDPLTY